MLPRTLEFQNSIDRFSACVFGQANVGPRTAPRGGERPRNLNTLLNARAIACYLFAVNCIPFLPVSRYPQSKNASTDRRGWSCSSAKVTTRLFYSTSVLYSRPGATFRTTGLVGGELRKSTNSAVLQHFLSHCTSFTFALHLRLRIYLSRAPRVFPRCHRQRL
ncbi:hypothetical protein GQ43DRAFT_276928 [Delitschia confertaspora ATCC 74209]|uniref:Uncharacterized protein n=1 Tax=Delitschia confertaspora ATCC 74209 TaxID=1513339 RepID=A0A9P4MKM2_9PLEO|nr:hypothetical protein GQ43DRAFT_276928 [Delitschia confertaspora ATCC 74209]